MGGREDIIRFACTEEENRQTVKASQKDRVRGRENGRRNYDWNFIE